MIWILVPFGPQLTTWFQNHCPKLFCEFRGDSGLECCVVWKRNMDSMKRWYSTTWGIWNMDMDGSIWWKYREPSIKQTKRYCGMRIVETGEIMETVRRRQKRWARSYPDTWLITQNNVRRTNTGEEGSQKTKNNVLGFATEDGRRR